MEAIGRKGDRSGLGVRLDADLAHVRLSRTLAEAVVILNRVEAVAQERPELIERWLGQAGVSEFEAKIESLNAAFTGEYVISIPTPPKGLLPAPLCSTKAVAPAWR